MTVRLLVRQRSEQGGADRATEVLLEGEQINLGRDRSCHVVLAQKAVSRTHARISRDGTLFFIEDLGSAYGTRVNGESLPRGEKRLLRNGDTIAIAQFDVTFDRLTDSPKGGNAEVARQVVKDVMRGLGGGAEHPYFRVMNGPKEGQRLEMPDAQELVIGRDETADLVFNDDLVSRRHAKVRRDWSGTHVEDLESRNGIKVNRKRVARKTLKDRDELEIGNIRLLYIDPTEQNEAAVVPPEEVDDGDLTEHPKTPPPEPVPEPEAADEAEAAEDEAPGDEAGDDDDVPGDDEGLAAPDEDDEAPEEEDLGGDPDADDALDDQAAPGLKGKLGGLQRSTLISLVAMGVFAILALVLVIAVLVGA